MDHVKATVRQHEMHYIKTDRMPAQGKVRPLGVPQEYIEGSGIINTSCVNSVSPSRQYSTVGGQTILSQVSGAESATRSTMNKLINAHPQHPLHPLLYTL